PYSLKRDTGVLDVWFPLWDRRYTVQAGSQQTSGRLCHLLVREPKGAAPPLHIHRDADETWYVIEGQLTIYVGDEKFEAGAGDFVNGPKGVPHTYLVRSERAEFVATFTPAGAAEGFFAAIGIPVVAGQPHPGRVPVQPEEFARKAALYSIEIVGPPPSLE
ncbi:MAG: cupin domain-containing protein, partial [Actinobacteria bacterium]|nr:cupin domain-containing protein [Actinomycetota bacterium]